MSFGTDPAQGQDVPSTSGGPIHSRAVLCHSPKPIGKILRNSSRNACEHEPAIAIGAGSVRGFRSYRDDERHAIAVRACDFSIPAARIYASKLRYFAIAEDAISCGPSWPVPQLCHDSFCFERAVRQFVAARRRFAAALHFVAPRRRFAAALQYMAPRRRFAAALHCHARSRAAVVLGRGGLRSIQRSRSLRAEAGTRTRRESR